MQERRVEIQSGVVRVVDANPEKSAGLGEVKVSVRAASINGADARIAREEGQDVATPGIEFAGVISEIGEGVTNWRPGDAVMGLCEGKGQGDSIVVEANLCLAVPSTLNWVQAGAFCEAFTTAHDALFRQGRLGPGQRLLVHGAAGGVGLAALQLGVEAGAQVVASVRNKILHARVAALVPGVDVIDPGAVPSAGPFDVILELIGASNFPSNITSLATGGRIVVIGRSTGSLIQLDLLDLMSRRGILTGSTLKHRTLSEKSIALNSMAQAVLPRLETGEFRVVIDSVYPLEDAAGAYQHFMAGGKLGNVVLSMVPSPTL